MDPRPVLALIVLLAGCAGAPERVTVQRVEIPVPVRDEPPESMRGPFVPSAIPGFISPSDPGAVAGLSREGVRDYQIMLYELTVRIREWEAWGFEGGEE